MRNALLMYFLLPPDISSFSLYLCQCQGVKRRAFFVVHSTNKSHSKRSKDEVNRAINFNATILRAQ